MCLSPINLKDPTYRHDEEFYHRQVGESMLVPCGHCEECQKDIALEWAYRCMDELKHHSQSCFITLTYAETDKSLHKEDFQKFLKRLRKAIYPILIRYMGCGEYGSKKGRPHFHSIIFGWEPDDLRPFFISEEGNQVYRSDFLSSIWSAGNDTDRVRGYITVEKVTFETAKYCSLYMQKFIDIGEDMEKPFRLQSRRPGIGFLGIDEKQILQTDKVYSRGRYKKTPRYYLKVLDKRGVDLSELKENRKKTALMFSEDIDKIKNKLARQKENFGKGIDDFT